MVRAENNYLKFSTRFVFLGRNKINNGKPKGEVI